jgi:methyltransferase (TIGR00027 family)
MREDRPSLTAYRVALSRAAHQLFDDPRVLDDPLALRIIGTQGAEELRSNRHRCAATPGRYLRAFVVARSRLAEDLLADAVQRGVRQYVVLGAGLDTFAYRNPYPVSLLEVFEVDHPATQAWKRRLLAAAGLRRHLASPGQRDCVRLRRCAFHGEHRASPRGPRADALRGRGR